MLVSGYFALGLFACVHFFDCLQCFGLRLFGWYLVTSNDIPNLNEHKVQMSLENLWQNRSSSFILAVSHW